MTLGKAYDEIMDKIEVTPELRRRVLARIEAENIVPARPRLLRFPAWRYLSAAACLVLVIAGAAVLPRLLGREASPPPVLFPPDIQEAASLRELSGLVGFQVTEEFSLPFEAEDTAYRAYGGGLAEIAYTGAGQTALYRQSAGMEDNSGDYTDYGSVVEITANGLPVTLKGDGGAYMLAVWTDGMYSYSLCLSRGTGETGWAVLLAGSGSAPLSGAGE